MLRRLTTLCAAVGLVAASLAGCGGSDGPSGPATIAPQDASLYFQATIRPQGSQKDAVNGFLSKVLNDNDPGAKIAQLVDDGFAAQGENRTYAEDVEPWLGDTAAVFTVGFFDNTPAAVAVSSDDPQAGVNLIRSESTNVRDASHDGTDYQLDENGQAFGQIDDFVVFGDEKAYQAAIEASKGDSLADSGDYSQAENEVPDDAIASAYLNMDQLAQAVSRSESVPSDVSNKFFDTLVGNGPVAGWVTPSSDSLEVAFSAGESVLSDAGAGDLLASLPSNAWLAFDFGDLGKVVNSILDQSDEITGFSRDTLIGQLRSRSGIDLDRDVLSWLGKSALFVSGTSKPDIGGALVIESKDPAASQRGLAVLGRAAARNVSGGSQVRPLAGGEPGFEITEPGTPKPLQVFQKDDKVVIAYGQQAAAAAVGQSQTLADSSALQKATADLGDSQATFFLDGPTVLQVAKNFGAKGDPNYEQAKPYLDALAYIVAASGTEGGRAVFRLLVGVQ